MKESYRIPVVLMIVFGLYWMLTSLPSKPPRFRGSGAVGGSGKSHFESPSYRPRFDMASTKKHVESSWKKIKSSENWLDALKQSREIFEGEMAEWAEKWKEIRDINPNDWYTQALDDLMNSPVAQERIGDADYDLDYTDEFLKLRDKLMDDRAELVRLQTVMYAERTANELKRSWAEQEASDMYPR